MRFVNVGAQLFKQELERQGGQVIQVEWQPPAGGNPEALRALDHLESIRDQIDLANEKAMRIINTGSAYLVDVAAALRVIPGMHRKLVLHAGPPIGWSEMCGPMRGAIIGGLLFEGLATDVDSANRLLSNGEIELRPAHDFGAVGPMAGIITSSMPVHVVKNEENHSVAFCTINEGLGKVLRFGAYDSEVLSRLRYLRDEFAVVMRSAILKRSEGVNLKSLIAQGLQMGDECHNRNKASTSLFLKEILDDLLSLPLPFEQIRRAIHFIASNDHYFLNLSMPSAKCILDAASGIPRSTLVTAMSRNGVEFGIQVSGLGKKWFTGQAEMVQGLMFPGYSESDGNRDLGDSAITETLGIGGFSMAASPAITQFVGGNASLASQYTRQMYQITLGELNGVSIPALNDRGCPSGIDIRKVVETGILPVINTGIAHKEPGVGQVGAGIVHPPIACFTGALIALERIALSP